MTLSFFKGSILLVALASSFAACGGSDEDTGSSTGGKGGTASGGKGGTSSGGTSSGGTSSGGTSSGGTSSGGTSSGGTSSGGSAGVPAGGTAGTSTGGTGGSADAGGQFACGDQGLNCDANQLCVKKEGGIGITFSCAANPCTGTIDCSCAGTLCGGTPYKCTNVANGVVSCICPQCA